MHLTSTLTEICYCLCFTFCIMHCVIHLLWMTSSYLCWLYWTLISASYIYQPKSASDSSSIYTYVKNFFFHQIVCNFCLQTCLPCKTWICLTSTANGRTHLLPCQPCCSGGSRNTWRNVNCATSSDSIHVTTVTTLILRTPGSSL